VVQRLIGRAVFLRHGETEYTDVFPDLTEEGQLTIIKSAKKIEKVFLAQNDGLMLCCSPAKRSGASAILIGKHLKFEGFIGDNTLLSPVEVRDKEKAKEIFDEFILSGGHRALSVGYATDERFEDPAVFEPRSQVKKRFYRFLKSLAKSMLKWDQRYFVICVSHYEVLYHFVESVFQLDYKKQDPLTFGEPIYISFYKDPKRKNFGLSVEFRGVTKNNIELKSSI
jgi:broad specificity phosphatase PhoE